MNAAAREARHSNSAKTVSAHQQDQVNRAVYSARFVHLFYLSKALLPAETACFNKYQQHIVNHDVLDVGVGAGRTSRYLAARARRYEAIDYSPVMVKRLCATMPKIRVHQADFRDLRIFEDGSFDFVLATANVIDALTHQDRLQALNEASRVLRPEGILAFSTHNLHYQPAFSGPRLEWSWNPFKLSVGGIKFALSLWNHARIAPLRVVTPEYALLNDPGHFYGLLHYYVARPVVQAQLANSGLRLLDVFDRNGESVLAAADDSANPSLLYVAQRDSAGISRPHAAELEDA